MVRWKVGGKGAPLRGGDHMWGDDRLRGGRKRNSERAFLIEGRESLEGSGKM